MAFRFDDRSLLVVCAALAFAVSMVVFLHGREARGTPPKPAAQPTCPGDPWCPGQAWHVVSPSAP